MILPTLVRIAFGSCVVRMVTRAPGQGLWANGTSISGRTSFRRPRFQLENLDNGCLGERYVEEGIRIERSTTHLDLYHAERVGRYLREIVQELSGLPARTSGARRSDAPA
jgi:hypothetical protein